VISFIKKSKHSAFIGFLIILLVLISTGFLLALIINFMHGKFSPRLIKISFVNSFSLAAGVMVSLFITRNLLSRVKYRYIFLISFGMIICVCLSGFLYILILEPFFFLYGSALIKSYLLINFVFALSLTGITSGFLMYQQKLMEKEKIITTEQLLRKEMEMRLHNARIQPHFLFNSLNLMVSLIPEPEKAEKAILMLSDIIRYHLDASTKEMIHLSEEIANLRKYLYLQKLRFEERLTYELTEDVEGYIPPLMIQPLVENSIKHNMSVVKQLHIIINIKKVDGTIVVRIADSCRAVTSDMIGKGTGLTITQKRAILAGGVLHIEDGGITLILPAQDHRGKNPGTPGNSPVPGKKLSPGGFL
jgi:two-component system, LytTR family, sensor kinase